MSTSKVAIITSWALLLLTMFPMVALAGRHVPAPPPSAGPTAPIPPPQVVLDVSSFAIAGDFKHDTQFRDASRKTRIRSSALQSRRAPGAAAAASNSESIYGHRLLVGSSPPTCQGKCGSCNPCNPIHVSIGSPHGALTQQEYYPEVWRCKCGNKLFMP